MRHVNTVHSPQRIKKTTDLCLHKLRVKKKLQLFAKAGRPLKVFFVATKRVTMELQRAMDLTDSILLLQTCTYIAMQCSTHNLCKDFSWTCELIGWTNESTSSSWALPQPSFWNCYENKKSLDLLPPSLAPPLKRQNLSDIHWHAKGFWRQVV